MSYMSEIKIKHVIPPVDKDELKAFLISVDTKLIPKLSDRVDIDVYADKLSEFADLFYLFDREKMIANAAVYLNHGKNGYISSFAILPEYQGKGMGRKLFLAVNREARKRGITQIGLEVFETNKRAIRFYEKQGFQITGQKAQWFEMTCTIE